MFCKVTHCAGCIRVRPYDKSLLVISLIQGLRLKHLQSSINFICCSGHQRWINALRLVPALVCLPSLTLGGLPSLTLGGLPSLTLGGPPRSLGVRLVFIPLSSLYQLTPRPFLYIHILYAIKEDEKELRARLHCV